MLSELTYFEGGSLLPVKETEQHFSFHLDHPGHLHLVISFLFLKTALLTLDQQDDLPLVRK